MRLLSLMICIMLASVVFAAEYPTLPLLAQVQPVAPVDMTKAQPRVMSLYEQGWNNGVEVGEQNAGKIGWFFLGFGNIPLMWLPWTVEPRRPAKPNIQAEEEYNSGYKFGYRAGWKNAHKTYYIAGTIVSSAAAVAVIATQ